MTYDFKHEAKRLIDAIEPQRGATTTVICALHEAFDAGRLVTWQPMDTIPNSVTRALFVWPAFKLDDNADITDQRCGEIVAIGYRSGAQAWEPSDEVNCVGRSFDDDFEYGDPILWQPLPDAPAVDPSATPEVKR